MSGFSCLPGADVAAQGQCPPGYVEAAPATFIVMDAALPDPDLAASVFALGFVLAFSTARALSMVIRAVLKLVRY